MIFSFLANSFDSRCGMVGTPAAYSASQVIRRSLWNPKVYYRLLSKIILSQFHHPSSDLFNIQFYFNFPSTPVLPTGLFPSTFPTKTLYVPTLMYQMM